MITMTKRRRRVRVTAERIMGCPTWVFGRFVCGCFLFVDIDISGGHLFHEFGPVLVKKPFCLFSAIWTQKQGLKVQKWGNDVA